MGARKGDFIEVQYVGKLDDGTIFDVSGKELAEKLHLQGHVHERTVLCLGYADILAALDDFLIDKELGKPLTVVISPEQGFGRKDPQLLQMIPMNKFLVQKINPAPGLRIQIDQHMGIIKSISGGRVIVDFNHPLAGRTLTYEITMIKKIDGLCEKVSTILSQQLHMHDPHLEERNGTVVLLEQIDEAIVPYLEAEIKKRIPELQALQVKGKKVESSSP